MISIDSVIYCPCRPDDDRDSVHSPVDNFHFNSFYDFV